MQALAAVPLAPLTTLRIGGPARRLVEAETEDELVAAVRGADAASEPLLVLAGGSNVVVADVGWDGTVARIGTRGVAAEPDGPDRVRLTVQAGEPWDDLVAACVADGLAGFECMSGIPGSTGATPIQNVGAYGQEVSETVVGVRVLDRRSGAIADMRPEECGFGYRRSAFRGDDRRIVLGVSFSLRRSPRSGPIRYAELARALDVAPGQGAPLEAVRAAVLELRRGKGMVVDPDDPDSTSAGSFFKNPILDLDEYERLVARSVERLGADARPPSWPEADGRVKTSAAWLIQGAGFRRGYARGSVAISSKHTLALVNRDGATAAELVALAREVAAGVEASFGIRLEPEPVFVGHAW